MCLDEAWLSAACETTTDSHQVPGCRSLSGRIAGLSLRVVRGSRGERIANVSGMSKSLACRVGRHSWETEMRRLDDVEAARPVLVCSRCGKTNAGERIASSHGSGTYGPYGSREVGGGAMGRVLEGPRGRTSATRPARGSASGDWRVDPVAIGRSARVGWVGMTGSLDTRLILLRGNSASGKSSLARAIRAARPRGIAILGQDQLRREILHAQEKPGNPTVAYLDLSARYALDIGLHVIEGILYTRIYGAMLTQLLADHRGVTRCYRYELSFAETARRRTSKPQAAEYGPDTMLDWWLDTDPLQGVNECSLGPQVSLVDATTRVLSDCEWIADPVHDAS